VVVAEVYNGKLEILSEWFLGDISIFWWGKRNARKERRIKLLEPGWEVLTRVTLEIKI